MMPIYSFGNDLGLEFVIALGVMSWLCRSSEMRQRKIGVSIGSTATPLNQQAPQPRRVQVQAPWIPHWNPVDT